MSNIITNEKNKELTNMKSTIHLSSFVFFGIMALLFNLSDASLGFVFSNFVWVLPVTMMYILYSIFESKSNLIKSIGAKFLEPDYINIYERNILTSACISFAMFLVGSLIAFFLHMYIVNGVVIRLLEDNNILANVIVSILLTGFYILNFFIQEFNFKRQDKNLKKFVDSLVEIEA